MASLSNSTSTQYEHHIKEFKKFCLGRGVTDYLSIPVTLGVEFLTSLFKKGMSYSTINSARSALSQYVHLSNGQGGDFGKHPLTSKFMRGVFKLRPPTAKYSSTWDVSLVLNRLRLLDNDTCTLKELTQKCVMLLALATGQRVQTLQALLISDMIVDNDKVSFSINSILKTSRPGVHKSVDICRFKNDLVLCPVSCLNTYLARTNKIRGNTDNVFISFQKPFSAVSSQSVSRWITEVLRQCNINSCFTAHSTRSASASKAALSLPIDTVLKAVGWKSEATFARFYNKNISVNLGGFGQTVLQT